jgi:hypothetical protein
VQPNPGTRLIPQVAVNNDFQFVAQVCFTHGSEGHRFSRMNTDLGSLPIASALFRVFCVQILTSIFFSFSTLLQKFLEDVILSRRRRIPSNLVKIPRSAAKKLASFRGPPRNPCDLIYQGVGIPQRTSE